MSSDYWLGVATLPLLALALFVTFVLWVRVGMWLEVRGITFEAKVRQLDGISDWTLRRDIWWERQFGPIFIGGWYREHPKYLEPGRKYATRWIGLGKADGPCIMGFHQRDLGEVPQR